jgi:hypothetical protein
LRLSPAAQWCVDIYHVSEHLHDCAKAMFGEGAVAQAWAQERLEELVKEAGPRFIAQLDLRIRSCVDGGQVAAMQSLRTSSRAIATGCGTPIGSAREKPSEAARSKEHARRSARV